MTKLSADQKHTVSHRLDVRFRDKTGSTAIRRLWEKVPGWSYFSVCYDVPLYESPQYRQILHSNMFAKKVSTQLFPKFVFT